MINDAFFLLEEPDKTKEEQTKVSCSERGQIQQFKEIGDDFFFCTDGGMSQHFENPQPANLIHLSIHLTMNEHGMQPGSAVFLTGTLATKRS